VREHQQQLREVEGAAAASWTSADADTPRAKPASEHASEHASIAVGIGRALPTDDGRPKVVFVFDDEEAPADAAHVFG